MGRVSKCRECVCPLEDILDVIGKKWALPIIAVIGRKGQARFNEILRALPGLTPKTLAKRLKELEAAGLVARKVYPETPPRVKYTLTKDGIRLRKLIKPLMQWAISRSTCDYSSSPCLTDNRFYQE